MLGAAFRPRCPTNDCSGHLIRDGPVKRPRRVVDVDRCFWLVGHSYACSQGTCRKKFRSWDQRVLARIPQPLAAEFPAHLTWRSGLSKRAFGVLRSCIQHGMGSSEAADLFRMQHLRRYDEMRLQYLQKKFAQMELFMGESGQSEDYEVYPAFEDHCTGGFTPSGQWLRDVYDDFIESHRNELNQHTAMGSGRVCAIDHSHKLAKHVFKVDGVPIFTALLTVTNEKGEIVVCVFVATKSHSQFDDALQRLAHDLEFYGHCLPEVFYTDNMVDKAMLERIFLSLLEAVIPVEKYSHLPLFDTPSFVCNPIVLDSETSINNTIQAILEDVPDHGEIVVGFNSEWNVDMTQYGRFNGNSPPAVIQIAYREAVYILQVGEMLSRASLPNQLVNFLCHAQVIKAGRQVNGDLGRLATACNRPPSDFQGGLDLAAFAKARFLVKKATLSLADLVASLLHQCLPKPASERISSNWSDNELSQAQLEYAARDAYASLRLYNKINETPLPTPSTSAESPAPGMPVILLTDDNKIPAARGTVLTITDVLVPAAIIGINKDDNKQPRSLASFGTAPFDVIAHHAHVRLVPTPATTSSSTSSLSSSGPLPASETPPTEPSEDLISAFESLDEPDPVDAPPATAESATPDPASATAGVAALGEQACDYLRYLHTVRSHVLKDIFHVFHMLYLSHTHGLRLAFIRAFRDTCLIPHPADKARIEAYLKTKDLTWEDMLRFRPKWLWHRCRRTVPPPELLYPLVRELFLLYGPLKDAKTGLPLFNAAAWKIAKNILELIRYGYVSDIPGVILYYCIGFDKEAGGLPLYRCIRGTNMVEGGVHTHLLKKLPSRGASVRHMVACLLDFVLRHNLTVGHFNSTGKKYAGHDSIWLTNQIQQLEITLGEYYGKAPLELSWVNGNLFEQSEQSVGIVKIPQSICTSLEIQSYNTATDSKQKQAYLAKMQGTRIPVLPVHTVAEKKLFASLMRTSEKFSSCKNSITAAATVIWNRSANPTEMIFYKLEEQLTSYFNGAYKDGANIRLSCSRIRDETSAFEKTIREPSRSNHIVNAPSSELVLHRVTAGFANAPSPEPTASSSTPPLAYTTSFSAVNQLSLPTAQSTIANSRKRALDDDAAASLPAPKRVQPTKVRHCPRCTMVSCAGRNGWYKCTNSCADCGKRKVVDCAGRSSRAKDKIRCVEASKLPPDQLTDEACSHLGITRHNLPTAQSRLAF
ncbi:3'-5' exonuclease domain-containing protein [Mycena indigotica]|uniref:3'-5' exonuclease n=1 Tax=Mycena indigotica TaxID=2126181 RepID=A0A8H6VQR9_9AGAR|nr:3'-5' exonuclease domain-containing protein [Mycena indigotica]KAF7290249.1 3'-5' exonuclease domain-containing protein [Mycena indigotica]